MCFDERKMDNRARPLAARRMARRTCACRLAVRSLSLDMVPFLLLAAVLAGGDQLAQQLARVECVSAHHVGAIRNGGKPHPQRGVVVADDDDFAHPQMTENLGEAHFFFPSLRKMYSPACLMPLAL